MNFIRKALVALATSLFVLTLFSTAASVAFNRTFGQPEQVKTWVTESGVYTNFVDVALQELQKATNDNPGSASLPIGNPEVQAVVKDAFPPELIQQSAESFIDGSYNWLEGEVAQPDFRIDLREAKSNVATGLAEYARSRYSSLPACGPNDIPQSFDPFTIACKVPGYDIEPEIQRLTQELATSKEFLGNPVITADNLQPTADRGQNNFFQDTQGITTGYQLANTAPYILGGLAVILAIIIVVMSKNLRHGTRRIGISLATTGILLVLTSYLANTFINWGRDTLFGSQTLNPLAQETLTSLVSRFSTIVNEVNTQFGIGYLLLAALIFITLLATRRANWFAKKKVIITPTDPDPEAVTNVDIPEPIPADQAASAPVPEPSGPPPVTKK